MSDSDPSHGTTPTSGNLASSGATTLLRDTRSDSGSEAAASSEVASDAGEMPQRIGRYQILRRLGEGGMGVVYAGYDEELGRKVAIKLLHPAQQRDGGLRARIIREAQSLARVSSPNVIHAYEVGEFAEQLFIVMEFVDGTTLARWQTEKRRSWQEILRMYCEAGQGLLEAHEAGLVHRDFKPENVLLGADRRPRVADFGLARVKGAPQAAGSGEASPIAETALKSPQAMNEKSESETVHPLTQTGVVMGTPLYMSPEQHLGEPVDSQSDQFSFCVALYEALYHQHPFPGSTVKQLAIASVMAEARPRPLDTNVPASVHEALLRGLAKSPGERFPSMRELMAALALDTARDPVTTPRAQRWVALSMPIFILLSSAEAMVLPLFGISEQAASLAAATVLCGLFSFVLVRFRRTVRNNIFHRTMMVLGMVWAGQILVFRSVGFLLGLGLPQILTFELVALLFMNLLYAPLLLPGLWLQVPFSVLALVLALVFPAYAQLLGSVAMPASMITCILAWNQKVKNRRAPMRRPAKS